MASAATWSDFELMVDALPTVGRGRYPQAIDEGWAPPAPPSDRGPVPVLLVAVPVDELHSPEQHIRCKMGATITGAACVARQVASETPGRSDRGKRRWNRCPECRGCTVGAEVRGRLGR